MTLNANNLGKTQFNVHYKCTYDVNAFMYLILVGIKDGTSPCNLITKKRGIQQVLIALMFFCRKSNFYLSKKIVTRRRIIIPNLVIIVARHFVRTIDYIIVIIKKKSKRPSKVYNLISVHHILTHCSFCITISLI